MGFSISNLQKQNKTYSRPNDPRLGDRIEYVSLSDLSKKPPGIVLLGYPDDEGIQLNRGRIGASEGPLAIRSMLSKLCDHCPSFPIYDVGNLEISKPFSSRHLAAAKLLETIPSGFFPISLGGGHDYAYPDVYNFLKRESKAGTPVVLNFDAHLDVRKPDPDFNSGTAFYRLLEEFPNFQLIQYGYQKHLNSIEHEKYCFHKNVKMIPFDEIEQSSKNILAKIKGPLFLSIDIDGFSSSLAPGVSAANPTGMQWTEFMQIYNWAIQHCDIKGLGIYETSPKLDRDDQTAKLAAHIIHCLIAYFGKAV